MNSKVDTLLKQVARAESGKLASSQIESLQRDLEQLQGESAARVDQLGYNAMTGRPTQARAEALRRGADAVLRINAELDVAKAETEALDDAAQVLRTALDSAKKREAPAIAREAQKRLAKAVPALEKAVAEVQAARAEAEQLLTLIGQARTLNPEQSPALSGKEFERAMAAVWPEDPIIPMRGPRTLAWAARQLLPQEDRQGPVSTSSFKQMDQHGQFKVG